MELLKKRNKTIYKNTKIVYNYNNKIIRSNYHEKINDCCNSNVFILCVGVDSIFLKQNWNHTACISGFEFILPCSIVKAYILHYNPVIHTHTWMYVHILTHWYMTEI